MPQTGLYIEDDGSLESKTSLTELYKEKSYSYYDAPSLPYVNIFRDNGNYTAKEVWVLNDGASASSTNKADWTVYENINLATELHFTNNPDKADAPNTIYIKDGTVIRLVADQSTSGYSNDATFYDYDITDDGKTTWDGTNGQHGINSGSNYTGSGAKLAFGNKNTGTGLGGETWEGNTLNAYNKKSLEGCTFSLVTGLNDEGHIEYADKVNAPNLFDDGSAQGKTTYNGWSLEFNRSGDTYTLSSVTGENTTKVDGLEYFNNPVTNGIPYDHIWTNNFWPVDNYPGKDGLTGDYMDRGKYVGSAHVGGDGNAAYGIEIVRDERVVVERRYQQPGRMRARRFLRQVRTFEMRAHDTRVRIFFRVGAYRADGFVYVRYGRGHRGGAVRRDTGVQVICRYDGKAVFRGLHAVVSPASVRMDVDESRGADFASAVRRFALFRRAYLRYNAVFDDDIADGAEFSARERTYVFVCYRHRSFFLTSSY